MNAIELNVLLYFSGSRALATLSSDFFGNCLTMDPHLHSHPKYELHYVSRGRCLLKTQTQETACPEGSFLLIPPHCLHAVQPTGAGDRTLAFAFTAEPPQSGDPVAAALRAGRMQPVPDRFGGGARLESVRAELAARRPGFSDKIRGELTALLADLARALGEPDAAPPALPEENRAERIEIYLMENCFDPACSCAALAAGMNLSARQVHRLCLQYFDAPFRTLLLRMRMEIADHRLRTAGLTVTETAAQLGYASAASFSAAYKRYFGRAPTRRGV